MGKQERLTGRAGSSASHAAAPQRNLTVLVIDGYSVTRAGLCHVVADVLGDAEVIACETLDEALARLPDGDAAKIVVADFDTLSTHVADGVRKLCDAAQNVAVVVCSMGAARSPALQAVEAGAVGFIPKSASPDEFAKAFDTVLSGGIYLPRSINDRTAPMLPGDLGETAQPGAYKARFEDLTPRQGEVLELLGRGASNGRIAQMLGISEYTVRLHVSAVLRKLDVSNRTQAAVLSQFRGVAGHA